MALPAFAPGPEKLHKIKWEQIFAVRCNIDVKNISRCFFCWWSALSRDVTCKAASEAAGFPPLPKRRGDKTAEILSGERPNEIRNQHFGD